MYSYLLKNFKHILNSNTSKDTFAIFIGTCVNVVAGGLFFIITPRVLGPADYGLFSTVIGTGVLATSMANFGIDAGILRFIKKSSQESKKYLSVATQSYLILGVVVAFLGFWLSPLLASYFGQVQITNLLRIAFAATILLLFTNLYVAALQADRKFIEASIVNISSNLARLAIFALSALFLKVDLAFVSFLFFLSPLVSLAVGQMYLKLKVEKFENEKFFSFHKYNFWIALTLIFTSIPYDNYFLLKFSGPVQVGIYAAPFKILTFVHQFASNFTRVLASRFASFDTNIKVRTFAIKSGLFVILFSIGLLVLAIASKPLLTIILGPGYLGSSIIFRWLTLGFIFFFAATIPSSIILYYFGKSQVNFYITLIKTIIFILLLLILSTNYQAAGAAVAFTITEAISFSLTAVYVIHKLR